MVLCALPTILFIILSFINFFYGGQPNSITTGKVKIHFDITWLIDLPRSIFFETLPLKKLFENVLTKFGISFAYNMITYSLSFVIVLVLFYLFKKVGHHTFAQTALLKISMLLACGFALFLCILSLFYDPEFGKSYVTNARYYWPVSLLFLFQICWVAFEMIDKKISGRIYLAILLVLSISFIGFYSVQIFNKEKAYAAQKAHLESCIENIHSENSNIPMVMFTTNFHSMTWEDKIPTYRHPILRLKEGVYFSSTTLVFIWLTDQEEDIIFSTNANIPLRKILPTMKKIKISSMSLYWKRFAAGHLSAN
jgi:hypothetical protein